ncbi:6361_t:CDS:2, partial [Entrophospora sp. SA101]
MPTAFTIPWGNWAERKCWGPIANVPSNGVLLLQVRCYSTKPSTDSSGQNSEDPEVNRKPKKRLTRAEKAGFSVPEDVQENNYRNDSQRWLARTNGLVGAKLRESSHLDKRS